MYQFRITKQENGGYRFDLKGIKMFVDDYLIKDNKHLLTNPQKAIAYFNIENSLYGISNNGSHFITAEDFFDAMTQQYKMFTKTA